MSTPTCLQNWSLNRDPKRRAGQSIAALPQLVRFYQKPRRIPPPPMAIMREPPLLPPPLPPKLILLGCELPWKLTLLLPSDGLLLSFITAPLFGSVVTRPAGMLVLTSTLVS